MATRTPTFAAASADPFTAEVKERVEAYFSERKLSKFANASMKINTADNTEVPARYGIAAIPTFLVIVGGEVVDSIVGQMSYDQLKARVAAHL